MKPTLPPAHLSWTDTSGTYQSFTFDLVEDEQWTLGSDITKNPVEVGAAISDNVRPQPRRVTLKVVATNEPIDASYWSPASMQPVPLDLKTIPGTTPWNGQIDAVLWDNQLGARVLAGTAAGLIGGAVGGALGGNTGSAVGGALGAVAGSALAGALFPGQLVHNLLQTDAPHLPAPSSPPPFIPNVLTFDNDGDFVQLTIQLLESFVLTGQTIDVYGSKSSCVGPTGIGGMAIAELTHARNRGMGTGAEITITLEEIRVVYTTTVPAPAPTAKDASVGVSKGNQGTFNMESDAQAETTSGASAAFSAGVQAGEADAAAVLQ